LKTVLHLRGLLCNRLLEIKKEQSGIQLISVLPFEKHSFADIWGALHRAVRNAADGEIVVSTNYSRGCYQLRNNFMVENSSYIICYWDGQNGGTAQTIRMAEKHGHSIHNLNSSVGVL